MDSPSPDSSVLLQQSGIRPEQREIASEILGLLPRECLSRLEQFSVSYGNADRGRASERSIEVDRSLPLAEFRAVLLHETLGHFLDLGCLRGRGESGESEFRDGRTPMYQDDPSVAFYRLSWVTEHVQRPDARDADFVTGYAEEDAYEDLAETITYYMLQEETFRFRAQRSATLVSKLQWVETYVFPHGKPQVIGLERWNGTIAWDSTKLPYRWLGKL